MLGKNVPNRLPTQGKYFASIGWVDSWGAGRIPTKDRLLGGGWYAIPDTRKKKPAKLPVSPQPDAEGWIPHVPGDKCPCDGKLKVQAKRRDGFTTEIRSAYSLSWTNAQCDADIISWRPAKPAAQVEPTCKPPLQVQIGGDHYKDFAIQPVEFITKNKLPFLEGCVLKRICRHKAKNGAEDIRKAIHELQLILELEYNEKP